MRTMRMIGFMLALGALLGSTPVVRAADSPDGDQALYELTPPRLSLTDGQVSFWRPGADDWATAQINTPLAPGDEISTSSPGNVEIQIGSHAFVRGWTNTQIGLENQEPDFIQFKVTEGSAAFDLRRLEPGRTIEVDTPNAAFTITQPGYYRVDVTEDRTSFITRRAGRATVIPAGGGESFVVTPSEELVIDGTSALRMASYVAPPLDSWDQWNYARTDKLQDVVSARYLAPGIYGQSELDQYGTWRVVPSYGSVWVPTAQRTGWTPYSTGSWMRDPLYGWTWVDSAPWGWTPYHYGRWVFVDGYWAWAPGPLIARPVYAPALVAFLGGPGGGVSMGGPLVGWVALGWGEPVVPWWGRAGHVREPSWRGWGGPRVVNNVVVNNTTVVNVQNINVYRNTSVRNAVVVVNENRFGHGPITSAREARVDERHLRLTHEAPQISAKPASFVPTASRGVRPPEASLKRSVVATRQPRGGQDATPGGERRMGPTGTPAPAPRIVSAPPPQEGTPVSARPPFGQSSVERPVSGRNQPPAPPRTRPGRETAQRPSRETPVTATASTANEQPGRGAGPAMARVETPPVVAPAATAPPVSTGRPTPPAPVQTPPQATPAVATAPTPPARVEETSPVATPAAGRPTRPARVDTPQATPTVAPVPPTPAGRPTPPARVETPPVVAPTVTAPPASPALPTATARVETPPVVAPTATVPSTPSARPIPPARVETVPSAVPTATGPQARTTPPGRRAEPPQAGAPVATAPHPPTPQVRRVEPPPVAAPTAPVPARATAPARVETPQAAAAQAQPQPPARRAAPPQAARSDAPGQAAPRLPGEPANRLAPNRPDAQPSPRPQQ